MASAAIALPLAAVLGQGQTRHAPAVAPDVVLLNGRIFTGDTTHRWAQALAVRGDRIVAVGTTASIGSLATSSTSRIDLHGRLVIPGINDAHIHLGGNREFTALEAGSMPAAEPTFGDVRDSLRAVVARTSGTGWIVGDVGPAVLSDSTARRGALDAVSARHPVMLTVRTGHGYILNSAALTALGVRDDAAEPLGGHLERDAGTGRLTGLLEEYAGWDIAQRFAETPPDPTLVAYMQSDGRELLRYGITSVQDMANAYSAARTLRVFRAAALPLRVRIIGMAMTEVSQRNMAGWDSVRRSRGATSSAAGGTITVSGIKWILDGTPIERLALLRRDYADAPGWRGRPDFPPDTVRAMMLEARARGEQLMLHSVGDSTVVVVLTEMERTGGPAAWRNARLRLEHGDGLAPDLRVRARALGIVVVENPAHLAFPAVLRKRFGEARADSVQPLRSLVAAHIPIAFGSDGQLNPFLNILFATTDPNNPGEAITVEQAVLAYTHGSAYAEFAEREKGTLAPGMLADLAVLSQDIFTIAPQQLPATRSLLTMVGGKVVYRDQRFAGNDPVRLRRRRQGSMTRPHPMRRVLTTKLSK